MKIIKIILFTTLYTISVKPLYIIFHKTNGYIEEKYDENKYLRFIDDSKKQKHEKI